MEAAHGRRVVVDVAETASPARAGRMWTTSDRDSTVRLNTRSRLFPMIAIGANVEKRRGANTRLSPRPTSSQRSTEAPSLLKPELMISRSSSLRAYQFICLIQEESTSNYGLFDSLVFWCALAR